MSTSGAAHRSLREAHLALVSIPALASFSATAFRVAEGVHCQADNSTVLSFIKDPNDVTRRS